MAPVLHRKEDIDRGVSLVRPSVVSVISLKTGPANYKNCTGFVIYAIRGVSFIAVESSVIEEDAYSISVCFHDGVTKNAIVFSRSTVSNHLILKVTITGRGYPQVNLDEKKVSTAVVIILSNIKENAYNTYSTTVICPDNDAEMVGTLNVVGTSDFFTLGCTMDLDTIIGAPIFDLAGHFVGNIHSNCGDSGQMVMFAQHADSFAFALRDKIKGLIEAGTSTS